MIHLTNIRLSFGARNIFDGLSWHIKPRKRIGLIGPNGTGKTTLLELLAGNLSPDSGNIVFSQSTRIGYLPQQVQTQDLSSTVLEEAMGAFRDSAELENEAEDIANSLKTFTDPNEREHNFLMKRLDEIHDLLRALDSHTNRFKAEKLLLGLGFDPAQLDHPLRTVSGGWRMRAALAKLILNEPDILLLDEPTNHLDIESIEWVENYLKGFGGTLLLVSHDRYFLDRMIDTVAELENGCITEYAGNYSFYLQARESRNKAHEAEYDNQQKRIKEIRRFIERFRYKNTKATQVQSRVKMLEKMEMIEPPSNRRSKLEFKFPEPPRSGKSVCTLQKFSKSYRDKNGETTEVFRNSGPLYIQRGDKIALIGKNGAGKSTLARMIMGTEPFEGTRSLGHNVEISFFAQHMAESLDPKNTVYKELETMSRGKNETDIRSLLGAFLFSGDDVYKPVSVLSGGEKSRLTLAKTLINPMNFLVLDEPTNHLDIDSRGVLTQALQQYTGTYIIISHDRHFLDQVVNHVWRIEEGRVKTYPGTYSEYLSSSSATEGLTEGPSTGNPSKPRAPMKSVNKKQEAEKRNKLYNKMRKQGIENFDEWIGLSPNQLSAALTQLEKKIESKEAEKSELETLLNEKATFEDRERALGLSDGLSDVHLELDKLYKRWEDISSHL